MLSTDAAVDGNSLLAMNNEIGISNNTSNISNNMSSLGTLSRGVTDNLNLNFMQGTMLNQMSDRITHSIN